MVIDHENDRMDVTTLNMRGFESTEGEKRFPNVNCSLKPQVDVLAYSCNKGCNVDSVTTSRVDDLMISEPNDWFNLS